MGVASGADIPEILAERFFARLLELAPVSVLDVGCGQGRLLRRCREEGIDALGIETNDGRLAELSANGFDVRNAPAERLPFDDGAFDWVTMRHVAHHLADERPALREAFRVARSGVLVAEPWLDLAIPSQRGARQFDAWIEEQHTRRGEVHRVPLSTIDFLSAVPRSVQFEADAQQYLSLRQRPDGWLQEEAARFLTDIDERGREDFEAIEADAARYGLSYNGTMILSLRRVG